jgi:hypothetical protein
MDINFWSSIVGGLLTLAGVLIAHALTKCEADRKEADHIMGVLQGIHDEVETLWENYMSSIGAVMEALPEGSPLNLYWPVTQEYFTIYNSNSFFIGKIKKHDLRKEIVATYARARGLIDSYRLNNDLAQKWEYAALLAQETGTAVHVQARDIRLNALIQYAGQIRPRHHELKSMVSSLLRSLRKEGVLSPNTR